MRSGMLFAMTVLILAGSWEAAAAQAAKSVKPKKVTTKPVEATTPIETAAAPEIALDTITPPADSPADSTHHKKKGLFGKAKSVMNNKVVQAVAKTAACTMVPGGQAIAGAIDAASSKSAGATVSGAAGAASGSSCMPGLGGAGMGGGGLAGAGVAGAAGGYPAGMAPGTMPMGAYGMGGDLKPMADCMGLTVEEYGAMTNPTGSEARPITKAEMKRAQQLNKKVGSQRQMTCSQTVGMQEANAQMAQMEQAMAQAQARGGMMPGAPGMAAGAAVKSEAPGQQVVLADDLAGELKKGKTAVRGIDWMTGSADLSPDGRPAFDAAMARLGPAMKESGQHFRLDLYLDQEYDDATISTFGPARLQLLQSTLSGMVGDPDAALQIGKTKRDKNPRLELVKVK